jgi:hypothetical protein
LRQDVTWADGQPLTVRDSVSRTAADDPHTPGDHYSDRQPTIAPWTIGTSSGRAAGLSDPAYPSSFPALPRHQPRTCRLTRERDETRRTR